ncbi:MULTISPECIES: SDR family oxidoreductase [Vibrio]|uniref:NAD(P)H-binding protein n=2 Tax=Vibrio TaxID=662 RepID=A0A7X4LMW6_9VIBR|nr:MULTISPECIES: SDR family oxidoreductase [Vibrio]MBF8999723.1 SDR family oxidoreductase [Vibrio nitrifigilis]MZI94920.1 NAD(P)H-binding protein [Vibrio eleionomae]
MAKTVLLAGATGYLGSYVARELQERNFQLRALVRDVEKLQQKGLNPDQLYVGEVTELNTISGCCDGVDTVISTIGITRQNDGLSYMDVDFQANLNLLQEAKRSGVRKFIYVSVLDGDKLRKVSVCAAKEKFVDELKNSGLEYSVIRPNGLFCDLDDLYHMAENGRVFLFDGGQLKSNPIHGADMAQICVDAIDAPRMHITAGGPDQMTHKEIAELAFKYAGKEPRITYIPSWSRGMLLGMSRFFTSRSTYGPLEFFMTVMSRDMLAPPKGQHRLEEYYRHMHHSQPSK